MKRSLNTKNIGKNENRIFFQHSSKIEVLITKFKNKIKDNDSDKKINEFLILELKNKIKSASSFFDTYEYVITSLENIKE